MPALRDAPPRRLSRRAQVAQLFRDNLSVKAQPTSRTAEPNRAKSLGIGVDPIALDAQLAGKGRGINKPGMAFLWFLGTQQLDDAAGNRLNQIGFAAGLGHLSLGLSLVASEFASNTA